MNKGKRMIDPANQPDPLADRLEREFGTSEIPLADMSKKYLGLEEKHAKVKASLNQLPFPVYRADPGSNKSPWLVNVDQLASHLRAVQDAAAVEHAKCKV